MRISHHLEIAMNQRLSQIWMVSRSIYLNKISRWKVLEEGIIREELLLHRANERHLDIRAHAVLGLRGRIPTPINLLVMLDLIKER